MLETSQLARSLAPFAVMRILSGVSLVVPYYHMVSDHKIAHVSNLYRFKTIDEFVADIEFLLRHFEPVSLEHIVDALHGRRALPHRCFHLTFDDGFREMHDVVAPILQRAGIPATFFLNTAFLDGGSLQHYHALSVLLDRLKSRRFSRATLRQVNGILPGPRGGRETFRARTLSIRYAQRALVSSLAECLDCDLDEYSRARRPYLCSDEVKSLLRRNFTIGAHSHDHPLYADLTLPQQLEQTRTSVQLLEERFGLKPRAFAFPHNDTGVDEAFFRMAFLDLSLDVSFGTAGLVEHFHPRNIERVSMEEKIVPAARILTRQFARSMYHRLRSRRHGS